MKLSGPRCPLPFGHSEITLHFDDVTTELLNKQRHKQRFLNPTLRV